MKRIVATTFTLLIGLLAWNGDASAFCGFYVAKADTKLFNKASEVTIARHDNKTVITMANDFKGDVKEFAMVVPVPTILEKDQIHIGEAAVLKHLADYSAPRLVEYFDENPCRRYELFQDKMGALKNMAPASAELKRERDRALGVTIEAQYTVGEYDILILSARESNGLETWLSENGYKIPNGASAVLQSYLKQHMNFFVAKINLGEQAKLGLSHLRPLQIAFESPKFMLPIRLGTVNADGAQELFIYFLTKQGRVETTNYRTIRLPEAQEIPVRRLLSRSVHTTGEAGERARSLSGICLGHELVRPLCGESPLDGRTAQPGCILAGNQWTNRQRNADGAECLPDQTTRPLRRGTLSRRPRVPGDNGPVELSSPLHPPPSLERNG